MTSRRTHRRTDDSYFVCLQNIFDGLQVKCYNVLREVSEWLEDRKELNKPRSYPQSSASKKKRYEMESEE